MRSALLRDRRGSEHVEKIILIALGVLVLLVGATRFSASIKAVFGNSAQNLAETLDNLPQPQSPEMTAVPGMPSPTAAPTPQPTPSPSNASATAGSTSLPGPHPEPLPEPDASYNQLVKAGANNVDELAEKIDKIVEPFIDRWFLSIDASIVKGAVVDAAGGTVHLAASTLEGGGLFALVHSLATHPVATIGAIKDQIVADFKRDPVRAFTSFVVPLPLGKLGPFARATKWVRQTGVIATAGVDWGAFVGGGADLGVRITARDAATQLRKRQIFVSLNGDAFVFRRKQVLSPSKELRGHENAVAVIGRSSPIYGDRVYVPVIPAVLGVGLSRSGGIGLTTSALPLPIAAALALHTGHYHWLLAYPLLRGGLSFYVSHPSLAVISRPLLDRVDAIGGWGKRTLRRIAPKIEEVTENAPVSAHAVEPGLATALEHGREEAWQTIYPTLQPGEPLTVHLRKNHAETNRVSLTPIPKAGRSLGGKNQKILLEAPDGSSFLAKPKDPQRLNYEREQFATDLREAAAEPTLPIASRTIDLGNGRRVDVYFKPMLKARGTLPADVRKWSQAEREAVLSENVWADFLGNHDTKRQQWIAVGENGNAAPPLNVDFDQSLNGYVQPEPLSRFKQPHMPTSAYNLLYREYVLGRVNLDFSAMFDAIDRIEKLTDNQIRSALAPFSQKIFSGNGSFGPFKTPEDLLRAVIDRRDTLRSNFEKLVASLEAERLARANGTLPMGTRAVTAVRDARLRFTGSDHFDHGVDRLQRVNRWIRREP